MGDEPQNKATTPESERRAPPRPDPKTPPAPAESGTQPPKKQLTPEEQMALYEDDLKENDWGHQPC